MRTVDGVPAYNSTHITTLTTTTAKTGPGVLHAIAINTKGSASSTATVYDNTAGSGTVLAVIDVVNLNTNTLLYDIAFNVGLTIVTATGGAGDLTVSWA